MPRRPIILPGPYFALHAENRMHHEGDVISARARFLVYRFRNLDKLLNQRYRWMNDFIEPDDKVVEFGCGPGFSKLYIDRGQLLLTDYIDNEWVDMQVDAMAPPFDENSIDVVICSHMVHHMASPITFFRGLQPLLTDNGRIIIQDVNTSLLLRILLRLMRHEGWSYDIDVFDPSAVANDPRDPWSANCAIPQLLFRSTSEFEKHLPGYKIVRNAVNECFLFPLSGGVIAKTNVPELSASMLECICILDRALTWAFPTVCAVGRSVVIVKR